MLYFCSNRGGGSAELPSRNPANSGAPAHTYSFMMLHRGGLGFGKIISVVCVLCREYRNNIGVRQDR